MTARVLLAAGLLAHAGTAGAQDFDCHVAPPPAGASSHRSVASAVARAGDVTLRVAALYTPEAADSAIVRGAPISTWISGAFEAWQAVLDSASAPDARVVAQPVGFLPIDVPETGSCFADLDTFFAHPRARELRDSLAANLVVLFAARCSAAYQCTETSNCEASAYAMARFAVAGAPTPEGGYALAHEVGHSLGMRHDTGDDPTPGYNHGYRNEPAAFFTLMATRGPLPRSDAVPAYSDPLRTFEGHPLGIAGVSDNARVLREIAPEAATWNQGVPTEPGPQRRRVLAAVPNPAAGAWNVTVASSVAAPARLELFDALGRTMWTHDLAGAGPWEVAVPAGAAPGSYLLRVAWNDAGRPLYGRLQLTRSR